MKLNIEALSEIYAEHLWLKLSDQDLEEAQPSPQDYSNETGRHYAYLNRLCLNKFSNWLRENLAEETSFSVFPNLLSKIWEFINGCGINLGSRRLVLIPSDAIDITDFAVPQEWVDIPNFAADYYLPVKVDLEEKYLHFWGFVSRQTLKNKADYDPIYRCYFISRDYVISRLEIIGVIGNLYLDEKGLVSALPKLLETEAEASMEELSKPSPYSPRLKVNFEKWGALLNNSRWLEKLYEQRVRSISLPVTTWHISQWLDGVIETGWQSFEELFNPKTLAPAFRHKQYKGIELETPEKINRAVRQLYNSQSEVTFPSNVAERDALVYLLEHTQDESIRWKAADYLWIIAPNYSGSTMRRVMDFGVRLMGNHIALMVAVLRKINGEFSVLLRAYPMLNSQSDRYSLYSKLPPGLRLIGLDESGNQIPGLETVARSEPQDDYISLYFSADVDDRFSVRLTLENVSITEQFMV